MYRIPYSLHLKKWDKKGEADDIFEKVPKNEAIPSCSPLIIQPKINNLSTYSTPWGNYRLKRLRAKSSQDVFDRVMFQIFGDIPL